MLLSVLIMLRVENMLFSLTIFNPYIFAQLLLNTVKTVVHYLVQFPDSTSIRTVKFHLQISLYKQKAQIKWYGPMILRYITNIYVFGSPFEFLVVAIKNFL